jgi:acyl-CoA thioester hydrolase
MRLQGPEHRQLTHESVMPIRWGDMDAMGHVNNTVYFRYFEVARLEWLYRIGAVVEPGAGQGPVIVNAWCNFVRQLKFPGDIVVRHFVADPGRSSFGTYLTVERTDEPGVLYAEGGAKTVWTDYAAGRSAPLPDWLRALLPAPSGGR